MIELDSFPTEGDSLSSDSFELTKFFPDEKNEMTSVVCLVTIEDERKKMGQSQVRYYCFEVVVEENERVRLFQLFPPPGSFCDDAGVRDDVMGRALSKSGQRQPPLIYVTYTKKGYQSTRNFKTKKISVEAKIRKILRSVNAFD